MREPQSPDDHATLRESFKREPFARMPLSIQRSISLSNQPLDAVWQKLTNTGRPHYGGAQHPQHKPTEYQGSASKGCLQTDHMAHL
jgi:hypothetical protein